MHHAKDSQLLEDERWLRTKITAIKLWGLLTRSQLRKLGYTAAEIRTSVRQGRLERIESGIYALPGHKPSWQSRLYLHTLKTGGRASHMSAALLWCLLAPKFLRIGYAEVRVPAARRPEPRERLKIHYSSFETIQTFPTLIAPPPEVRSRLASARGGLNSDPEFAFTLTHPPGTRFGIPCTPVDETLLDIATTEPLDTFLHCYAEAVRQSLIDQAPLIRAAQPRLVRGRRGSSKLQLALDAIGRDAPALSGWSYLAAIAIEADGLPRPLLEEVLYTSSGRRIGQVDLWWPQFRIVIELDGQAGHANAKAFQSDRRRDALLAAEGITVLRFTWAQYCDTAYFLDIVRRTILAATS